MKKLHLFFIKFAFMKNVTNMILGFEGWVIHSLDLYTTLLRLQICIGLCFYCFIFGAVEEMCSTAQHIFTG